MHTLIIDAEFIGTPDPMGHPPIEAVVFAVPTAGNFVRVLAKYQKDDVTRYTAQVRCDTATRAALVSNEQFTVLLDEETIQ